MMSSVSRLKKFSISTARPSCARATAALGHAVLSRGACLPAHGPSP